MVGIIYTLVEIAITDLSKSPLAHRLSDRPVVFACYACENSSRRSSPILPPVSFGKQFFQKCSINKNSTDDDLKICKLHPHTTPV
jgi:hypothetical protein